MQALERRYVYYINKVYKRSGKLWESLFLIQLVGLARRKALT